MTARVLVVDDIAINVRLLEAQLMAEYFEVVTASNGPDALAICMRGDIDIVILDVMMPGMDGFDVCRKLKDDPRTHHIPVIMVTALDQPTDKVNGLEAGADDFLPKPVNEIALITRVKNLTRLKMLVDELRTRAVTGEGLGLPETGGNALDVSDAGTRLLLVDDRAASCDRLVSVLQPQHTVVVEHDPQRALFKAAEGEFELVIVSLGLSNFDGLRLCSQIRSLDRTRHLPIIMITEPDDNARLLRGLDMGVNDYVVRPVDKNELLARIRTQLRRARYTERLRDNFQHSVELAVTDGLTGLHNRRYMESHLGTLVNQAAQHGKNLSILIADIDYFKAVNDTYGHDVGDAVLREFAERLRRNIRGIDLACRYGGEEFVVVMPDTDLALGYLVGERLRQRIAALPFAAGEHSLSVTVSVGIAGLERPDDGPDTILRRADQALYAAKRDGRNRVVTDAA